jgi:hypothetical protein
VTDGDGSSEPITLVAEPTSEPTIAETSEDAA